MPLNKETKPNYQPQSIIERIRANIYWDFGIRTNKKNNITVDKV